MDKPHPLRWTRRTRAENWQLRQRDARHSQPLVAICMHVLPMYFSIYRYISVVNTTENMCSIFVCVLFMTIALGGGGESGCRPTRNVRDPCVPVCKLILHCIPFHFIYSSNVRAEYMPCRYRFTCINQI